MNAADRKRIEELERRVRELEARPPQVIHYPVFTPYVPVQPVYPAPAWPPIYHPWCSSGDAVKAADATACIMRVGDLSGNAQTVFAQ